MSLSEIENIGAASEQASRRHEQRAQGRAVNVAALIQVRGGQPLTVASEEPQEGRHWHRVAMLHEQLVGPQDAVPRASAAGYFDRLCSVGDRAKQDRTGHRLPRLSGGPETPIRPDPTTDIAIERPDQNDVVADDLAPVF